MVIKVNFRDRDLQFKIGEIKGSGIKELLEFINSNKNKEQIKELVIDGESGSYTFSRQVYLLVNVLSEISGSSLIVNGRKIPKGKLALPVYNN